MLVLLGRRHLRPASRCVHGDRARVSTARFRSQSFRRPGRLIASRAFCFCCNALRLTREHGMKKASWAVIVAMVLGLAALPSRAAAQSLAGLWDASVVVNGGVEVPFGMEIAGSGSAVKGSFFNGDQKVTSTTGQFENGALVLSFDEYGTKLEAAFK